MNPPLHAPNTRPTADQARPVVRATTARLPNLSLVGALDVGSACINITAARDGRITLCNGAGTNRQALGPDRYLGNVARGCVVGRKALADARAMPC